MGTFVTVTASDSQVFSLNFETEGTSTVSGTTITKITYDDVVIERNKNSSNYYSEISGYSTDAANSGSKSLKLGYPKYGHAGVSFQATGLEKGAVYKLSAYVKLDASTSAKATGVANMSTITTGVYYVDRKADGTFAFPERSGTTATATSGGVTATSVSDSAFTLVEREFYIPDTTSAPTTVKFAIVGIASNKNAIVYYYVDDVKLEKVGEAALTVVGDESIEIPKADQGSVSVQYSGKVKASDIDLTDLVGATPTFSLGGAYPGVSLSGNTLTVDKWAYAQPITISAEAADYSASRTVQLTYTGDLNPQVRDLSIIGTVLEGETLTAEFKYYDPSGKAPNAVNGVTIAWYGRDDSEDEWHIIQVATALAAEADNEYTATYTFTSAPEYNEAKCIVNLTNEDGLSSAAADSNVLKGPVKPEIKGDVTISGNAYVGGALEAQFLFHDDNGDPEGEHIYQWYRLDSATDVTPEPISGATNRAYSPTTNDMDKFLQVQVTPVAVDTDPQYCEGTPKTSAAVVGPRKPRAENLRITQNNTVDGLILTAVYDYVHEPGLPKDEEASEYQWFFDGELVSTEAAYTVPVYSEGDVYVKVTPVAQLEPTQGVTVTSSTVHVNTMEPLNIVESWGDFEAPLDITYSTMDGYTDRIIKLGNGEVYVPDTTNNHSKGQATIVGYTTEEAYSGTGSLELAQLEYFAAGFKAEGLETGAVYRFSAWMKLKKSGDSATVGLRTVSNNNAKGIKVSDNVASSFIDTNSDATTAGSKTVGNTTVTATGWTKVSGEFYIPATSTPSTKTVNFGFAGKLSGGFYVDDISVQKISVPTLVVEGDATVEVPKESQQPVTIQYDANMMAKDINLTAALGAEPTLNLQAGTYEGISFDTDTNTLTVDNTAFAREIVLEAYMPAVSELTHEASLSYPIQLTYTGSLNPQVRNLIVSGGIASGNTLTAEYTPYDPQGKTITTTVIRWEGKNVEDENWTLIPGESALTLGIGGDFPYETVRCVVELTVELLNEEHIVVGSLTSGEVYSNVAVQPTAPEVKNITVTGNSLAGNVLMGETLTVTYDWYDVNDPKGDTRGTDRYQWYRLASADATPVPISGETSLTYSPTLDDTNMLLQLEIIPVSTEEPYENTEERFFSDLIQGPLKPVAQNVSITKSSSGNILTANYDYVHPQNVREGVTTFAWYMGGRLVSTASQYTVPADTTGNVYVQVTPVAEIEPTTGVTVTSATISVNTVTQGGGVSGTTSTPSGIFGTAAGTKDSQSETIVGGTNVEENAAGEAVGFTDVQNHWAKEYIEELVEAGILKGVSEDSFAPDLNVSRAEFCTMIYRALGLASSGGEQKFNDVTADKWYYESVQAVAEKGIINGDGQNFNPEREMTRQEMAKVIWGAISDKVVEPTVQAGEYNDAAQISDWAKDAINSLSVYKVLEGSDGEFRPLASMTRAEAAAVISRVLRLINGGK